MLLSIFSIFSLFIPAVAVRYIGTAITGISDFLSWAPRVALARLIAKWRSLLTIIAGAILGASIGALIPLYTTAIAQLGLVQRMEEEPLHDTQVQLRVSLRPATFALDNNFTELDPQSRAEVVQAMDAYRDTATDNIVTDSITSYLETDDLEGWLRTVSTYVETDKFGLQTGPEAGDVIPSTRASFIYLDDWENHVRLVEGTLPAETPVPEGVDFNVAIGFDVAREFNIEQGDVITVNQRIQRDGSMSGGYDSSIPFNVYVTAIVVASEEDDPFWMGTLPDFNNVIGVEETRLWDFEFKFLTAEENVYEISSRFVLETAVDFGWRVVLDHEDLSYVRIDEARSALTDLQEELRILFFALENPFDPNNPETRIQPYGDIQYNYHTRLVEYFSAGSSRGTDSGILQDYAKKQSLNEVPFSLLLLQIGALVLFFLMVTAMLVRRGERREIAMFQSRGAWGSHILALRGIEALIICVAGGLVAPFLSQQLLKFLGPIIAGTDDFPLPLTGNVFFFSFLAAGVTFVALTMTLIPVLRLPLISAGGAALRSSKMAWWQRYYVDVLVAVLGLAVLGQLISRESPLVETNLGDQQVDILLLLAPAFLFLGLGSIALRVFPLLTAFLASLLSGSKGVKRPDTLLTVGAAVLSAIAGSALIVAIRSTSRNDTSIQISMEDGDGLWIAGVFILVFVGILLFRVLPEVSKPLVRFGARREGMPATMALWQLSREPVHYARITFLLALAVAIGWFATSFRATVRSSQVDQAAYTSGADIRMVERDTELNVERTRDTDYYVEHPDIEAASLAYRIPRVNNLDANSGQNAVSLLAVDPRTFGDVTLPNWREDLENIRVPYLPEANLNIPEVGIVLPGDINRIGMWVRFDTAGGLSDGSLVFEPNLARLINRVNLGVRLQDDEGAWMLVPVEPVQTEYLRCGEEVTVAGDRPGFGARAHIPSGWVYYEADMSALEYNPSGDVRLVSIYWDHRSASVFGEGNLRIVLAEMSIIDDSDNRQLLEIFEDPALNWRFLEDSGASSTGIIQRDVPALGNIYNCELDFNSEGSSFDAVDRDLLAIRFNQDAALARMGINVNYPDPLPLQGIISQSLHEEDVIEYGPDTSNIRLTGLGGVLFNVHPAMKTEYFPTLYNDDKFVVVDVRELMYTLNQRPVASYYPTEVWLELEENIEDVDRVNQIMDDLTGDEVPEVSRIRAVSYAREFDTLETDPLALGLLGLMFLAFIIALVLSIVGLLTYSALTAQARRSELGVLRALGLSSSRVVLSLMFEQFFVVIIGGLLGSLLGYLLSVFVVPTLALGTTGEGVVPPFITETEWSSIGNFWLIMGVMLTGVFILSFLLVRQLSLIRSLRLGDE